MRAIADKNDLAAIHARGTGFVHNPEGQKLHAASCDWVRSMGPRRKLYFETREQAETYLERHLGGTPAPCPDCLGKPRPSTTLAHPTAPVEAPPAAVTVLDLARGYELTAPSYVPYDHRTQEEETLRALLQERALTLQVAPGEVLHATFTGYLPRATDVENALFYNIGGTGLAASSRHGLRFERLPAAGEITGVTYRYEIVPADGTFRHWRATRPLARISPIELGTGAARPEAIWWHAHDAAHDLATPLRADEPFALFLDVRGTARSAIAAVKPLIDGIVSALQAETKRGDDGPARRVASMLGVDVRAVVDRLTDRDRATLGTRSSLVHNRGTGVQWTPSDHLCVAANLSYARARSWTVSGIITRASNLTNGVSTPAAHGR
jgi:hypothetical protein